MTAPRARLKYRAANLTPIANPGEQVIQAATTEAKRIGMASHTADLTKPVGPVHAMMEAGGRIVVEKATHDITDKTEGTQVPIKERHEVFFPVFGCHDVMRLGWNCREAREHREVSSSGGELQRGNRSFYEAGVSVRQLGKCAGLCKMY